MLHDRQNECCLMLVEQRCHRYFYLHRTETIFQQITFNHNFKINYELYSYYHYLYSSKRIGYFQRQRLTCITYGIYVKTWAQSCKSVHFVRFETFIMAYFLAVTIFDSTWRVTDQSANVFITISTTSTATLSISWYMLDHCNFVLHFDMIDLTWSAASNVRLTVTKTSFSASSTKEVIPI